MSCMSAITSGRGLTSYSLLLSLDLTPESFRAHLFSLTLQTDQNWHHIYSWTQINPKCIYLIQAASKLCIWISDGPSLPTWLTCTSVAAGLSIKSSLQTRNLLLLCLPYTYYQISRKNLCFFCSWTLLDFWYLQSLLPPLYSGSCKACLLASLTDTIVLSSFHTSIRGFLSKPQISHVVPLLTHCP